LPGAALFYGDSILTPAISVLSAVEGLRIIAPPLADGVLPISILVLGGLFILQVKGAVRFSRLFSPVICLWFVTLGGLGAIHILRQPEILAAVHPQYAVRLLIDSGGEGFLIMGAVVLAITGVEILYADMGYFGLSRIRFAWFGFVFPALLLNYFGQGALLLTRPVAIENPFYLLAPVWAMVPLLLLSTLAAMIVSQAVIWGTFSMTRQAIQLGYCPRIKILHVSDDKIGQIYIPSVNWLLMLSVFALMLGFQTSSALASAYGIAVTGVMIADTLLAVHVFRTLWRWQKAAGMAFLAVFLTLDLVFLAANSLKIPSGGWLPLAVAAALFLLMTTWIKGRLLLREYMEEKHLLFEDLEQKIKKNLVTVEGTAIYLARSLRGAPQVLLNNLEHNHVVHEQVIVMTIVTTDEPYVDEAHRVKIRAFGERRNFYRVKL
jgi:KUP system potassium uptake protein